MQGYTELQSLLLRSLQTLATRHSFRLVQTCNMLKKLAHIYASHTQPTENRHCKISSLTLSHSAIKVLICNNLHSCSTQHLHCLSCKYPKLYLESHLHLGLECIFVHHRHKIVHTKQESKMEGRIRWYNILQRSVPLLIQFMYFVRTKQESKIEVMQINLMLCKVACCR